MRVSESAGGKTGCIAILKSLEAAVLEANSFPPMSELEVLEVTSSTYRKSGKLLKTSLTSIIRAVASRYAVASRTTDSDSASTCSTSSLTPRDHLYDETIETTEEALECFNAALDAARGIQDAIVQPTGALGPSPASLKIGLGYLGKRHGGFLDIEKPQVHFPDYPIDNSDNPFIPPYSQTSNRGNSAEEDAKTQHVDRHLQDLFRNNSHHDRDRRHPYEEEISAATAEMATKKFKEESTVVFGSLKDIPCTVVTTEEELLNIAERLKQVSEVAVDLENHSVRSFQGFTCLLQISTRREDFVIDTLKLRGSINRALAPVFTDETITKILHGADKDVQWLERDFGMYVVNMFDTGQAARLLKLPSAALSFLLTKYCDVKSAATIKKRFQVADWRQRPLPKDMFEYARSDTHYLLYIYDRVRSELSKKNLLTEAWERSAKVSRKRHSKMRYDPYLAGHLAAKHGLGFDGHQLRLLETLLKWRDARAREEDESLVYVAPLYTLFGIVRARDKARTVPGLMSHGFPARQVPPLIHKHAETIARFVSDALDAKLEETDENGKATICRTGKREQTEQESPEETSKDCATGQELSNMFPAGEQGHEAMRATETNLKTSSENTKLPEAKLRQLSKCAFFDSDSDSQSGSDGDEQTFNTQHSGEQNRASNLEKELEAKHEEPTRMMLEKLDSNEDEQTKGSDRDDKTCADIARAKGILDLSDNFDDRCGSKNREDANQGRMKAAQVAHELEVELAEEVSNLKSADFETELEARRREQDELVNMERALEEGQKRQEESREERKEEITSILDSVQRKDKDNSRRRKRKRVREERVEAERLDAFDYARAMKEMKSRNEGRRKEKSFDPMEALKCQQDKTARSGAKRRRRGRGKSMSFVK